MQTKHTETDEELVRIVRSQNSDLYEELVKRYEKKLLRYATYLVNNSETAADVVQEAFIKAYINLHEFNTHKKFSSWIYRIVHNEAMNSIKKNSKTVSMPEGIDFQSSENVEDDLIKKELRDQAQSCLSDLPILYREPLALYYLDEKSYTDISDILRIPMGTVATRINRAKTIMKKLCLRKN